VAVFIDWPNDMMTNYLNLPLAEKQDYWRIFGAEAYANGLFPAFHLKDTVGSPTAEQQGMLDFLRTYARFYADHRWLFTDNAAGPEAVRVGTAAGPASAGPASAGPASAGPASAGPVNVAASLLVQRGTGRRTIHLVNHTYDRAIVPQTGLTVAADVRSCPRRVAMVSPDFAGTKAPAFSCRGGRLTVAVDRLDYYDVLVLR
jgi:hypothetical protein